MKNSVLSLAVGLLVSTGAFGFATVASAQTIVDIAVGNPNFSSLVGAVSSQGLVPTLQGTGPFTVFAPTNDAFANVPGFINRAFEAKPELLKKTLLYHVVPGDLVASKVLSERRLKTAEGSFIFPNQRDGKAFVNVSEITATDIDATNGTIHVINKVLVPADVAREAARMEIDSIVKELRQYIDELRSFRGGH